VVSAASKICHVYAQSWPQLQSLHERVSAMRVY
jgi:hypothetical protein